MDRGGVGVTSLIEPHLLHQFVSFLFGVVRVVLVNKFLEILVKVVCLIDI